MTTDARWVTTAGWITAHIDRDGQGQWTDEDLERGRYEDALGDDLPDLFIGEAM